MEILLRPIGVVRSSFREAAGTPIQPSRASGTRGQVIVEERFRAGLQDLIGFERIWLISWFHKASHGDLMVTPYLDTLPHGVFATRSPARPSPIGISAVRLLQVSDGVLEIADVDIVDGSPVLDIKPYVPEFDSYPGSRAGWFDESRSGVRVADDRFARRSEGD
jgi:tRNA-Thr(GGU) m(6)t(6)A37 methyltransferase TsaA